MPFWILRALPVQSNKDITEASAHIKEVCRDLIIKARTEMAEKGGSRKDIISTALESGNFTDEQLVNQCMTFLAAGYVSSSTTDHDSSRLSNIETGMRRPQQR